MAEELGCFIDDLATGGHSHEQCAQHAARMFDMLASRHLLAGGDKVFLGLTEIRFLGFLLRDRSVLPDPDKTAAVERLVPPTTRSDVRGFLGLAGYYRNFVERFSHRARPLTELLKEDTVWAWSTACQGAFEGLKAALISAPILALPDLDRPFIVSCDYSHHTISAVLE